jgi:uncharacterized protein (TIGR02996 family)
MDQARAFLEAIRDEPEDDTPRLIFADWLDDHGDADRAEFIRAQVRLAALPENDPARPALEDEVDDLLAAHEAEWTAPLRELALEWEFRRGLVERVTVRAEAFLEWADRLFATAPVRAVRLLAEERDLPALAQSPYLGRVEGLDLSVARPWPSKPNLQSGHLRDRAVQALLASPHLKRLTALELAGNGLEGPAIVSLVKSPLFRQLRYLNLTDCRALGDRAARALAEGRADRLEVLRLHGANFTQYGVRTLLNARGMPRLHTLELDLAQMLAWPGRVPLSTLGELLAAPIVPRLTSLSLERCRLGDEGAAILAADQRVAGLTALDLSDNGISAHGLRALAESPHLGRLRALRLSYNRVGDSGAQALAQSPFLTGLHTLDLAGNGVGGGGVPALAQAPGLAGLRDLDLSGSFIGPTNVRALADSPNARGLTRLMLADARIDTEAVRLLAGAAGLGRLRELDLGENLLTDADARVLADSPHLGRLRLLALGRTGVGVEGAEALLQSPRLRRLNWLALDRKAIDPPEQERLRAQFGNRVTF